MLRKGLPILILGLTLLLTAAAIEFVPETLVFPVVEYSASENLRIALHKNGELDRPSCEQAMRRMTDTIRASCPTCSVAGRCVRGLDAERRKIHSQQPLPVPSLRLPDRKLTMTISTSDATLALGVCRQIEMQSATKAIDQRLRCFPASMPRLPVIPAGL